MRSAHPSWAIVSLFTLSCCLSGCIEKKAASNLDWYDLNYKTMQLTRQNQHAVALPIAEQALQLAEKINDSNHPNVATSLNNLAGIYEALGRKENAENSYRRAIGIYQKSAPVNNLLYGTALNNLAMLYMNQERYSEAEPLLKQALKIGHETRLKSQQFPMTVSNNLINLYLHQKKYSDAAQIYRSIGKEKEAGLLEKRLPENPSVTQP